MPLPVTTPVPVDEPNPPIESGAARPAGTPPLDLETLYNTRNLLDFAWSADGAHLFFEANISGRLNLWRVPAAGGLAGPGHRVGRADGARYRVARRPMASVFAGGRRRRERTTSTASPPAAARRST
jgi:hypothetical protein